MKLLLTVTCMSLFLVTCADSIFGQGKGELHIGVVLTTGEHSRDSNSQATTLTVAGNAIVWQQTFRGRGRGAPLEKTFSLSRADHDILRKLISANNLLVTDSIELPQAGSNYRYFEISVDLTLGEAKGAISISGPRTAVQVKEEKLYQDTLTLVKELYRIMNGQDKSLHLPELILKPIM